MAVHRSAPLRRGPSPRRDPTAVRATHRYSGQRLEWADYGLTVVNPAVGSAFCEYVTSLADNRPNGRSQQLQQCRDAAQSGPGDFLRGRDGPRWSLRPAGVRSGASSDR